LNNKYCYTLENLQLTNINQILKTLLPVQKQPANQFSNDLTEQILNIAKQKAESYAKKVKHYKGNLLNRQNHIQPCYHKIMTAIENRERIMIERAQYHAEKKIQLAFRRPINNTK